MGPAADRMNKPDQSSTTHAQKDLDSTPAQHGLTASGRSLARQTLGHQGQDRLPALEAWAGVDAAVQAMPVQHRVPVQAIRLSPALPDHQVSFHALAHFIPMPSCRLRFCKLSCTSGHANVIYPHTVCFFCDFIQSKKIALALCRATAGIFVLLNVGCAYVQALQSPTQQPAIVPTQLELQALQKLRESLSAGAEKPLRAFTCVRDEFIDTPEGAVPNNQPLSQMLLWGNSASRAELWVGPKHPVL